MSCTCEVSRSHDQLAAELERVALALSACVGRFADIVNLVNPETDTYDTRLATVQRVVEIAESVIASVPTEDLR